MASVKAILRADDGLHARRIAAAMEEAMEPGPDAVTVFAAGDGQGWLVEAYFDASAAPAADDLAVAVGALVGEAPTEVRMCEVPNENWVAISQAALPPVFAGRYIVHGSHDRARTGGRLGAIEIDAGEAFGTAHHASTLGCLFAIDMVARQRRPLRDVLDLGCGSGVLAIAAARALPDAHILASDIDPQATAVARANTIRNRVGNRIRVITAIGLAHASLRRHTAFDLVIANILARPLIELAPHLRGKLKPGGMTILSGILSREADAVTAAYRAQDFVLSKRLVIAGWTTLVLTSRGRRVVSD
jgi:ribosomal protein L11 methyltransferase